MPISDYINKHKAAGTLGKKTPTLNLNTVPTAPAKLTPSQFIAREKARGMTISSGSPEKVLPLRKLAQKLPFGFEKNVFDPVAKALRMLAPRPTDFQKQIINENPSISNEQLQAELRKRMQSGGGLVSNPGPITADTRVFDMPDIAGLVKKVGAKVVGKGEQAVTRAVAKATPAQKPVTIKIKTNELPLGQLGNPKGWTPTERSFTGEVVGETEDEVRILYVNNPGTRNEQRLIAPIKKSDIVSDSRKPTPALPAAPTRGLPKPKGKSPSEYMRAGVATEQPARYHGTSKEFEGVKSGEEMYSSENIYGQGFYTTDNLGIAEGYTKKGRGGSPAVYDVSEKSKVNLYDIEKETPDSILKNVNSLADSFGITGWPKGTPLRQIYDELRDLSAAGEFTADDVQDFFEGIKVNIEEAGYRGISHVGGKLTGKDPHGVNIYWYPEKDLNLAKKTTPTAKLATEPQPTGFDVRRSTQEELSNLETEKAVLDDFLRNDPAGKLVGKVGRGDNTIAQLQENAIRRGNKTTRYDDMTELGYTDTDTAQSGVEAYRRSRERLNEINTRIKEVRARDREATRLEKEELKSLEQYAGQTDSAELPIRPTKLTPPRPPKKPPTRVAAGTPDGKLPERRFLERAKEMMPDNKPLDRIDGQYVPRSTDELAIKAKNLINDDPDGAQNLLDGPINDRSVAVASELLKKLAREAEGAADNVLKDSLYERAAKVANEMAEKLTEAGRTVQAATILGRLTPEGQLRFFAREIQKHNTKNPTRTIPGLTKEEVKEILDETKRIFDMPEGEAKIRAFSEFQKKMRTRIPSALMEKILTVWRAGLLTGLKSTGLNIASNIVHGGAEVAKDVVATGADMMMSVITGKRTKSFTLKGLPKGVKEGFEKGWNYWKSGYDPRDISRNYEFNEVRFKSKIIQGYVDTVFRTLAATDQPLYYGALRRSLRDQAITTARNEGLTGSAMRKRATELESAPTEDMSIYSLLDAETAVFINRTQLGDAAKKLQDTFGGAGKFVIPFARTPSSVAMQVLNYSPVGIPIEVLKQIKAGKFDQRNLAQAIGRSITGTVPLMWLGSELFDDERISLSYPETERERELWKAEGRTANSIKVGDKWLSVQVLGPLGPLILSGAYFKKSMEETGSPTEAMFAAMSGTLSSFFESTFLRGLDQFISAITDPARSASGFAASYVSSWIPSFINDVARATDDKERFTGADTLKDTIMNRIKSRIPGLRQSLEEQVDVLGADVGRLTGEGTRGGVSQMINPTRPSLDRSTGTTEELRRLSDAGFDASPTRLGQKKTGYDSLTPEQNTELWRRAGELTNQKLTGLFKLPQYQRASDEEKTKIIKKITTQAQERARAQMVLELTKGLSGQALINKLSEAKASGLLTEPVLVEYKKLRSGTE